MNVASVAGCYFLTFVRIAAFVAFLPGIGQRQVPRTVKLGLVFALTWLFAPQSDWRALEVEASWVAWSFAAGREFLLGSLMAFTLGIILEPVKGAGAYLEDQIGLSLGSVLHPGFDEASTVVGQILEAFAIVLFFSLEAHHGMLMALAKSFELLGLGSPLPGTMLEVGIHQAVEVSEVAMRIAFPLGFAMFLATVFSALLMRAVPQFHFLSVAFTVRILAGLIGLILLFPEMVALMMRLTQQVERVTAMMFQGL